MGGGQEEHGGFEEVAFFFQAAKAKAPDFEAGGSQKYILAGEVAVDDAAVMGIFEGGDEV